MSLKLFIPILWLLWAGCTPGPSAGPTATPGSKVDHGHDHSGHGHSEHEHEVHTEGEVELSAEQRRLVDLRVAVVSWRWVQPEVTLPATLVGDPDLEVKVPARSAGVVSECWVRTGDRVLPGQLLAAIESVEVAQLQATYRTQLLDSELAQSNLQRRRQLARLGDTVRRPYEEAQKELAQARAAFQAAEAALQLARQKHRRLEELLRDGIASLQQVEEARAQLREAQARQEQARLELQVGQTHYQREARLQKSGLVADGESFQAQQEFRRSQSQAQATRDLLLSYGAEPAGRSGLTRIHSPRAGVVLERLKAPGERVEAGEAVLSLLDPSRLWAWVDLPESEVEKVALGSRALLRVKAYPEREFWGRVSFITPVADPDTKKIRARLELDNADLKLRPNMFAQVTLNRGKGRKMLAVPVASLARVENQDVVYIEEESGHYHRRPVKLGELQGFWAEILQGLKPGEKVVSRGTASLQAEDLKATMGDGGHSH